MITRIINGKLILSEGIVEKYLYIENGKITAVTNDELFFDEEIDANGNYVSPGFIDIHVHGGGGYEFVDATFEAVKNAANIHFEHGTTTIYPTISAYDYSKTVNALETLRKYKDNDEVLPHIYGVHLEGPYFSPKQSGAQDPEFIRTPDENEYTKLYNDCGDIIKRWSYAPELPNSNKFLNFLIEKGIIASAGHTDAEYSHIKSAYENGMKLITHLYSCTSTITRKSGFRILGVIETAYFYDDIDVETITDGCHLPPELISLIYKIKSDENMCLVTDAIRHGGMDNVESETCENGNMPYIIEDGVAKLADRSAFAGSIATTDVLVRTCVKKAGIPMPSAIKMITEVPARIMKLDKKGKLCVGYDADILILDEDINIKKVMTAKGEII
ncbi:MAG: N-acetylglucosamine-6-phosphate deacetylase [Clostridia bacterium]|nr:N-acetylglucosamine-6-phosphate deacetylase [Clostridia bacterium]